MTISSNILIRSIGTDRNLELSGITIDFTPKGGPDNFRGRFEAGGDGEGIRFVKDKNFWPKVKACTPLPPCSSGVTPCA